MTARRQVVTDTAFLNGGLRAMWVGFWALWFRGPGGAGMLLFRALSLAAVIALAGAAVGIGGWAIVIGVERRDAGKAIGGLLSIAVLGPVGFWFAMMVSGFLLEALNLKRVLANFVADLAEGSKNERLAAYRAARAEQIAAGRAKTEPPPQPEAAAEAPAPRPWYRPEPPPGAALGPRRIEDTDPPPSS